MGNKQVRVQQAAVDDVSADDPGDGRRGGEFDVATLAAQSGYGPTGEIRTQMNDL